MSDAIVYCPHCKQKLEVPEDLLGQNAECPSCSNVFLLPKSKPVAVLKVKKDKLNAIGYLGMLLGAFFMFRITDNTLSGGGAAFLFTLGVVIMVASFRCCRSK